GVPCHPCGMGCG
ncbi:chitin binding domain protein, partial [Vibrio parahaemolyticus V-223/04]